MAANTLTCARAWEMFDYDPATGAFHWKSKPNKSRCQIGDSAGWIEQHGYVILSVDRQRHKAHRVAFLMMTGEWPKGSIDHINGVKGDNRFANLRDVTDSVNTQNQTRAHRRSTTGLLGVKISGRRWAAKISYQGRDVRLGTFDTPEEAHAAYVDAKRRLHPGCTI